MWKKEIYNLHHKFTSRRKKNRASKQLYVYIYLYKSKGMVPQKTNIRWKKYVSFLVSSASPVNTALIVLYKHVRSV